MKVSATLGSDGTLQKRKRPQSSETREALALLVISRLINMNQRVVAKDRKHKEDGLLACIS